MITRDEIKTLVSSAVALGIATYGKAHLPESDIISYRQAVSYMRFVGMDNAREWLDKWLKEGKIHHRKGEGRNAKVNLSLKDLQSCILEMNIYTLLNK